MQRDFSPLYKDSRCVICGVPGRPSNQAWEEAHIASHLADGSACVQLRYDRTPPTEQVVATDSLPVTDDDGSVWDATSGGDPERHDTNSENLRRALTELAATKRRIRALAKENR